MDSEEITKKIALRENNELVRNMLFNFPLHSYTETGDSYIVRFQGLGVSVPDCSKVFVEGKRTATSDKFIVSIVCDMQHERGYDGLRFALEALAIIDCACSQDLSAFKTEHFHPATGTIRVDFEVPLFEEKLLSLE